MIAAIDRLAALAINPEIQVDWSELVPDVLSEPECELCFSSIVLHIDVLLDVTIEDNATFVALNLDRVHAIVEGDGARILLDHHFARVNFVNGVIGAESHKAFVVLND